MTTSSPPPRGATRFAPTPSGRLHIGHAYAALFAFRVARRLNLRFLLRHEDLDAARCSDEALNAVENDLRRLGIRWDETPTRQSRDTEPYRRAAQSLKRRGLLYPCFASRREIAEATDPDAPRDPDGAPVYPGIWRDRSPKDAEKMTEKGLRPAWRLNLRKAINAIHPSLLEFTELNDNPLNPRRAQRVVANPEKWGDPVLVGKDAPASYHLACVVDDAQSDVVLVVRGKDLAPAAHLHVLLQRLLNLPVPRYAHHSLVLNPTTGEKLSKSRNAPDLETMRRQGSDAQEIIRRLKDEFNMPPLPS